MSRAVLIADVENFSAALGADVLMPQDCPTSYTQEEPLTMNIARQNVPSATPLGNHEPSLDDLLLDPMLLQLLDGDGVEMSALCGLIAETRVRLR